MVSDAELILNVEVSKNVSHAIVSLYIRVLSFCANIKTSFSTTKLMQSNQRVKRSEKRSWGVMNRKQLDKSNVKHFIILDKTWQFNKICYLLFLMNIVNHLSINEIIWITNCSQIMQSQIYQVSNSGVLSPVQDMFRFLGKVVQSWVKITGQN